MAFEGRWIFERRRTAIRRGPVKQIASGAMCVRKDTVANAAYCIMDSLVEIRQAL